MALGKSVKFVMKYLTRVEFCEAVKLVATETNHSYGLTNASSLD